jgi:hypothetical protein
MNLIKVFKVILMSNYKDSSQYANNVLSEHHRSGQHKSGQHIEDGSTLSNSYFNREDSQTLQSPNISKVTVARIRYMNTDCKQFSSEKSLNTISFNRDISY